MVILCSDRHVSEAILYPTSLNWRPCIRGVASFLYWRNRWKSVRIGVFRDILKISLSLIVFFFPLGNVINRLFLFQSLQNLIIFCSNLITLSLSLFEVETFVSRGVSWGARTVWVSAFHPWTLDSGIISTCISSFDKAILSWGPHSSHYNWSICY